MSEVKIVGSPIDERVHLGEPGFAENKIILVEGVEDGIE